MYKSLLYTAHMLKAVPLLATNNIIAQQTRVSDQNFQQITITSNLHRTLLIQNKPVEIYY